MSEVRLYRNNKTGNKVAAIYHDLTYLESRYTVLGKSGRAEGYSRRTFEESYTPLPEAPEVGSTAWAIMMMEKGHKVTSASFDQHTLKYLYAEGNLIYCDNGKLKDYLHLDNKYKLYEEPIVTCLPHDFVPGQEVLAYSGYCWEKGVFIELKKNKPNWCDLPYTIKYQGRDGITRSYGSKYCLPYKGNEHLEKTVNDGEHGAVPDGYEPPHMPKLGDDDYWQAGDDIINLGTGQFFKIERVENGLVMYTGRLGGCMLGTFDAATGANFSGCLRMWYHSLSYVSTKDGSLVERNPIRSGE